MLAHTLVREGQSIILFLRAPPESAASSPSNILRYERRHEIPYTWIFSWSKIFANFANDVHAYRENILREYSNVADAT